eukprot:TRINITY_DN535_c0_g1_i1.p1 TRINITY_DN535_c0_g1~~TRINITY_DN535_c0_g1_i1.p1  ORF type:complete len:297 (-),score=32.75 TRINITY_DN535_c0_g1_i1:349-1239(-)
MNMKQISSPITGPEPLTFIPYSPPEGTHTNSSISNFNNSLNHNHVVRLSEISERISNVESTLINFIQKVDKDLSTMKSSIDQLSERCNALTNNAIRQENVSKIQQEALVQVHNYINQRVGKLFSPMPDVKPAEHESRKRKFEPDMSSLPLSKVPRSSSDGIALHEVRKKIPWKLNSGYVIHALLCCALNDLGCEFTKDNSGKLTTLRITSYWVVKSCCIFLIRNVLCKKAKSNDTSTWDKTLKQHWFDGWVAKEVFEASIKDNKKQALNSLMEGHELLSPDEKRGLLIVVESEKIM